MFEDIYGDFRCTRTIAGFKKSSSYSGREATYTLGDNLGKEAYTDIGYLEMSAWEVLNKCMYQTFLYEHPVTKDCHVCLIDKTKMDAKMTESSPGIDGTVLVILHPENVFEGSVKDLRIPMPHRLFAPDGYHWNEKEGKEQILITEIAKAFYGVDNSA